MKTTFLYQTEIRDRYFTCDSLANLILELERDFQKRGEVVCQVSINDLVLQESDEVRLASTSVEEIFKIEVKSERPSSLILDVVSNWEIELPKMIQNSDQMATLIRTSGLEGHFKPFVQLIDSCQFLIDSLISIDSIIEIGNFIEAEAWARTEVQMTEAVGQALSAFEKKDYNILADVLEYDLANALQSWFDLFKQLNIQLQVLNSEGHGQFTDRLFKKVGSSRNTSVDHPNSSGIGGSAHD